ncbi:hypothetical protein Bbelb_035950 [Branchiostoma belcheri]|nr:hypothetical protein Bbelb_035950 [Branchiostoma belcheri]
MDLGGGNLQVAEKKTRARRRHLGGRGDDQKGRLHLTRRAVFKQQLSPRIILGRPLPSGYKKNAARDKNRFCHVLSHALSRRCQTELSRARALHPTEEGTAHDSHRIQNVHRNGQTSTKSAFQQHLRSPLSENAKYGRLGTKCSSFGGCRWHGQVDCEDNQTSWLRFAIRRPRKSVIKLGGTENEETSKITVQEMTHTMEPWRGGVP